MNFQKTMMKSFWRMVIFVVILCVIGGIVFAMRGDKAREFKKDAEMVVATVVEASEKSVIVDEKRRQRENNTAGKKKYVSDTEYVMSVRQQVTFEYEYRGKTYTKQKRFRILEKTMDKHPTKKEQEEFREQAGGYGLGSRVEVYAKGEEIRMKSDVDSAIRVSDNRVPIMIAVGLGGILPLILFVLIFSFIMKKVRGKKESEKHHIS